MTTKFKKKKPKKLSDQVKEHSRKEITPEPEFDGNTDVMISTGSTLLDLAISGGRVKYGGIPGGILVEVFGPSSIGKTVLLCEIAGNIQRQGGEAKFNDPEARLSRQFARMFGFKVKKNNYATPDIVPEVFEPIRKWNPKPENVIHGVFADSLAALSTKLEMTEKDGDKMGMRRAKELSEECRKTCRVLKQKNFLMVCSNQVRVKADAGKYEYKYITPGGEAVNFYSSLRLRGSKPTKIDIEKTINDKKHKRIIGVKTTFDVYKSSVWKPYHTADIYILFDYGIDDIRGNLRYLKKVKKDTVYLIGNERIGDSIDKAIKTVEESDLENELREETIMVWNEIEEQFKQERKRKRRF